MEENIDNNKILDFNNEKQELEFKYNFVTTPWDDRTTKSKIWVVALLVSIFVVIMALVANNFYMHYRNFVSVKTYKNSQISCYRLRADELLFVARLQSVTTYKLLCLGAVVSPTSVLANGVCVKFGKLRMFIGSTTDPRCRKGFSVDVSASIEHPGVLSKQLVLLSSYENIQECSTPIAIGHKLEWGSPVYVIGRPFTSGKILSRQKVSLVDEDFKMSARRMIINYNYTVIARGIGRCPVRAGDLMLQGDRLFGLAAFQRNDLAFFAPLSPVRREMKEIDADITFENEMYISHFLLKDIPE